MTLSSYAHTLLTASVFAFAPLSLAAATEHPTISPEAAAAQAEHSQSSADDRQSQTASQPGATAEQRAQDQSSTTRNPEADRRDMEQRYPTTQTLDEKPSDVSKHVGS